MDSIAAAVAAIQQRLEEGAAAALDAVLAAWAEALRTEIAAISVSGHLEGSVEVHRDGPFSGHITLAWYGDLVARGVPGTTTVGLSGKPVKMRALSDSTAAKAARRRYQARVGHAVTHPNDFAMRAWQAENVQAELRRFPQYAFSPTL